MLGNFWFKKEKPFLGLTGMGGGVGGYLVGGGAGGPVEATGGTTATYTEDGVDYKAHIFTYPNSDNFEVTAGDATIEYIVVAGGGSGGSSNVNSAGGGGGGGVVVGSAQAVVQTYVCSVGNGGLAVGAGNGQGANGGDSFFGPPSPGSYNASPPNGISAMGGGAGAVQSGSPPPILGVGKPGGSGGGASYPAGPGGSGQQPTISQGMGTNTNYGNDAGSTGNAGGSAQAAGGGGAVNSTISTPLASYFPNIPSGNGASAGGLGLNNKYRTGSDIMYGAGGGADGYTQATLAGNSSTTEGIGGGGVSGYPGLRNAGGGTGNGGGGGAPGPEGGGPVQDQSMGGHGGSGIIVVRYRV